ncbi:trafficking protein particle complex subunit 10 [Diorhabda sublineata]|uniref:trafficking protein particle complex subunit 10 n=1 Tax=Diorhabda sublineata TaxID=1163346 RepID=UPI0024E18034|nr:trafficking protein particle complex subunit 10 [Diorhabda sublineata]
MMNGTELKDEGSLIDRRPIITCAGEIEVFSTIEDNLTEALPQETYEWRRTFGRPIRSVHIGAVFIPYSPIALSKGSGWDLIRQPLFHIYWTDCSDLEAYKTTVKEDIENWLKELTAKEISDWLIVVVENFDGKRTNKLLPRTTVLDKIRADFAPKQGDRCISVINPGKIESRSADSWRGLVNRIRHLLLTAYAKAVYRLEEYVRQQREKRNESGWNFMQYFSLQEELAQVLEMLGLYDEALVQYDELDALFSQFVVNGITNDCANWLNDFQKPLQRWHGLKLGHSALPKDPSVLELRAYLFAKQAHMLLLTNKVWEMASRCLPFLHTCSRELLVLEITSPPGAVACWLFLAAMEVLNICDKFNRADEVEEYSLHTAGIWEYASQKIRSLGELCGLTPGQSPTSEQLHIVVGLSAGMGDNPGTSEDPSPTDKLKIALCSKDAFNKMYLELAELAMGTYKHIGRLRSARLVGRELSSFYILLGETQKAAAFLTDLLKTFEQDGWRELAAQTQIELAECFLKADDIKKYICACASIGAALEIDTLIRWTYFDDMCKCINLLKEPLIVPFSDIFKVISVCVKNEGNIMQDDDIKVELIMESNFPKEILCTKLAISLETVVESVKDKKCKEKICTGRILTDRDMKMADGLLQRLKMKTNLEFKQDKQLAAAGVASKFTELRRKNSAPQHLKEEIEECIEVNNTPVVLTPGLNLIRLKKRATQIGKYYFGQISIQIKNLHIVSQNLTPKLTFEVNEEHPTLKLYKKPPPLLTGIEQSMNLIITTGSYILDPSSIIKLIASPGLSLQTEPEEAPLQTNLEIEVGNNHPFSSTRRSLRVLADPLCKDHQVTIHVPWTTKPIVVSLAFTPPLTSTWKLFTVLTKKFVQITVSCHCDVDLLARGVDLNVGEACGLIEKNSCGSNQIISKDCSYSYIWELVLQPEINNSVIKCEFSLVYNLNEGDNKLYRYLFEIIDYQTLYILDAVVEPAKGSDFRKVGIVCHLHLTIENVSFPQSVKPLDSIMYEVLADQSLWAVCGRTAGVVSFETQERFQTVVLDVMPLTSGYLPLPLVRISKYIPAESGSTDKSKKADTHPRLEPFSSGQVYNKSKGMQVHVIANTNENAQ